MASGFSQSLFTTQPLAEEKMGAGEVGRVRALCQELEGLSVVLIGIILGDEGPAASQKSESPRGAAAVARSRSRARAISADSPSPVRMAASTTSGSTWDPWGHGSSPMIDNPRASASW